MLKIRRLLQGVILFLISPLGFYGSYAVGYAAKEQNLVLAITLAAIAVVNLSLAAWLVYRGLRTPFQWI